jgi:L-aminopeptidase/D-esterase-like protein
MKQCMKGGVGSFTVTLPGGVMVASLVAVNAMGDVRDPATGKIVAGARKAADSREFVNTTEYMKSSEYMKRGGPVGGGAPKNTTLGVVVTNAKLNKVQANKLAQFAGLGMARTIYPVNTMADGDIVFALSLGDRQADINVLGVAAAEALAESILRAVRFAKSLGGVPGLG